MGKRAYQHPTKNNDGLHSNSVKEPRPTRSLRSLLEAGDLRWFVAVVLDVLFQRVERHLPG